MEGNMNFVEAIQSGIRNYVGFSGRAQRSAFWYWCLFAFLVGIAAQFVDAAIARGSEYGPATAITGLALFLPGLAVSIRRLHDLGKSGWFFLLILIPLIGAVILLIWFCMRGTIGPNNYGPDPLPQA
jgi:uncharacterized membrane protein YhaH (DUF805 family)